VATACGLALLAAQAATPAFAGPTEQASAYIERLAGVQPSPAVLAQMVAAITNQRARRAGRGGRPSRPIRKRRPRSTTCAENMVMPWTNADQTVRTVQRLRRHRDRHVPGRRAVNTVLSGDILYTVNAPGLPGVSRPTTITTRWLKRTAWTSPRRSYRPRIAPTACPPTATAGVITTAGAQARFSSTVRTRDVPVHHDQSHV